MKKDESKGGAFMKKVFLSGMIVMASLVAFSQLDALTSQAQKEERPLVQQELTQSPKTEVGLREQSLYRIQLKDQVLPKREERPSSQVAATKTKEVAKDMKVSPRQNKSNLLVTPINEKITQYEYRRDNSDGTRSSLEAIYRVNTETKEVYQLNQVTGDWQKVK
ncbi:hypothetical protein HMPREF3187_00923 [Aerococcus christensenii]|uniref:Uncharacterized protein n=2 Tax=Aerococcus christensenii TaxID=87541 RepID=A0A133XZD2_9LACT|nr:hypothetical protein HMPREF3187_00923 [Aerococcus christensenii]